MLIERISPAIEHVDGSSGAMGTAVRHAIDELVGESLWPAESSRVLGLLVERIELREGCRHTTCEHASH